MSASKSAALSSRISTSASRVTRNRWPLLKFILGNKLWMLASITSSTNANFNSPSLIRNQSRNNGRHFYAHESGFIAQRRSGECVFRVTLDGETDVETEIRDVRKRTCRIDSLRRQHQEDVLHEVLRTGCASRLQKAIRNGAMTTPLRLELRKHFVTQTTGLLFDERRALVCE